MNIEIQKFKNGYTLKIGDKSHTWEGKSQDVAKGIGIRVTEYLLKNREDIIKNLDKGII